MLRFTLNHISKRGPMMYNWNDNVCFVINRKAHYNDVTMDSIASQITSLTIVYSAVHSGTDQSKHQSSASWTGLCACMEFTRDRWIPRTNGQLRGKCFHLMTSSCNLCFLPGSSCSYQILESLDYTEQYTRFNVNTSKLIKYLYLLKFK